MYNESIHKTFHETIKQRKGEMKMGFMKSLFGNMGVQQEIPEKKIIILSLIHI